MPVRDGAGHVRLAIESILRQTFTDFEFVIVDDASTDATPAILAALRDDRVRLLTNATRLGLTRSLKRGLEVARGEYVARQDADDVSRPTRLDRQVRFLDDNRDVALIGSDYIKIKRGGERALRTVPRDCLGIRWRLLFVNSFAHSSVAFRRSTLEAVGGYGDEFRYAEDYELWTRLASKYSVANVPEVLVEYREGSATMTATYDSAAADVAEIIRRYRSGIRVPRGRDLTADQPENISIQRALLFGDANRPSLEELDHAVGAVLELHQHFCAFYGLTAREAARHRAWLLNRLARGFLRRSSRRLEARALIASASLLVQALRLTSAIALGRPSD